VLLRASPELAERLSDLGVEIAHVSLEPQSWPAQQVAPAALLANTSNEDVNGVWVDATGKI
jgi:hypothetical protein